MEWIEWIDRFALFFLLVNIILAARIVYKEKKSPVSTWAWMLILLLLPLIGFFIYWIFGRDLHHKNKKTHTPKTREMVQEQLASLQKENWLTGSDILGKYKDLIYMQLNHDQAPLVQHNETKLYTDGKKKFDDLFEDIRKAEDHIHLQYYIIRGDNLAHRLIDLLTEKAEQGVEVRFLYDALGSFTTPRKKTFKKLLEAGGEVEAFFPVKYGLLKPYINHRNHRKAAIIDGQTAYTGGFNVGDEYLGLKKKFGYWRDTHLRLKGYTVHLIQEMFISDWNKTVNADELALEKKYFPTIAEQGNVPIQLVSSGPEEKWDQVKNGFLKLINHAEDYIYVQTPYFVPDQSILDSLRLAALSGVDVRVMIPNKPDHAFVHWATYSYMAKLLEAGARAYEYENGFLHSKTLVADDQIATMGTTNVDIRSTSLNFEMNAFIYDKNVAMQLREAFEKDMAKSSEVTMEQYRERSFYIRLKESVSRLVGPLL